MNECCDKIFIIVGFNKEQLIEHVKTYLIPAIFNNIIFVENANFSQGMFSSIQAGLHVIDQHMHDEDCVMLHLVDQPHIPIRIYKKLANFALVNNYEILIPSYNMKAGHPILLKKDIIQQVLSVSVTSNLKDIIQQNKAKIHYIDVDSEAILQDINTQKEKEKFVG